MHANELHQPITNYAQAEAFLLGLVRDEPRPYASHAQEGVRLLLDELGNPHLGMRFVHIAGSKGKGSVALMSEALFEAHGIRTATFTSPHLRRWNERFRIGAKDISDTHLIDALERIRSITLKVAGEALDELPSFFDVLCAAAMLLFREVEVDLAIIECGLGGRYDATNIITPDIACITGIEPEHQDKLGNNIVSITSHKAGIIKPHTPIVCAPLPASALTVVRQQAQQLQAPLYCYGEDFRIERLTDAAQARPDIQNLHYTWGTSTNVEFRLACYGRHMAENAALALTLLHCLSQHDLGVDQTSISHANIANCLADLNLPGRGQMLSRDPFILVDSAHTPTSLKLLRQHLDTLDAGQRKFLISLTRGKDPQAFSRLLNTATHVYITCVDSQRSMPAAELAKHLSQLHPQLEITDIEDPAAALKTARENLTGDQILCICGSVYLAGFVLERLRA